MRSERKRMKEIDGEMEALMEAMKAASEKGDLERYQLLQERYSHYLQMQLSIGDSKKDRAGNKISVAKILVDLAGVVVTGVVGFFGINAACKADEDNVIVNQRSWNLGTDFLRKNKR